MRRWAGLLRRPFGRAACGSASLGYNLLKKPRNLVQLFGLSLISRLNPYFGGPLRTVGFLAELYSQNRLIGHDCPFTIRRAASIRPVLGPKQTSRPHRRSVEDGPETEVRRRARFGRDQVGSGYEADIEFRQRLTHKAIGHVAPRSSRRRNILFCCAFASVDPEPLLPVF